MKVQIGRDYQLLDPVPSKVGQTLDRLELAANKVLIVYDRPRARDADDIARLAPRFGLQRMLDIADRKQVEPWDRHQLANAVRMLQRIKDVEFPYPENAPAVKQYMGLIANSVESNSPLLLGGPYANSPSQRPKSRQKPMPPRTPPTPLYRRSGICGARTSRGGICRNPAGSCPHH